MLNTIKASVMFLALTFVVFLPEISYAWDGHRFREHVNPDLTLVTGMDTIDNRVLIASDPDQTSEQVDQDPSENAVPASAQSTNTDGDFTVVNVSNKAGGYTPIRIERWGSGYLGPQGELYYPFPEVSQLKAVYGL